MPRSFRETRTPDTGNNSASLLSDRAHRNAVRTKSLGKGARGKHRLPDGWIDRETMIVVGSMVPEPVHRDRARGTVAGQRRWGRNLKNVLRFEWPGTRKQRADLPRERSVKVRIQACT